MADSSHTQCDIRAQHNQRCPKRATILFTFVDAGLRPRAACIEHAPEMRDALTRLLARAAWSEAALQ